MGETADEKLFGTDFACKARALVEKDVTVTVSVHQHTSREYMSCRDKIAPRICPFA